MRTPFIIVGACVALGLVVLAGIELWNHAEHRAEAQDFDDSDPRDDPSPRSLPAGIELDRRADSTRRPGVEPVFQGGADDPGDMTVDADTARAAFANALAELDQILIDKKRLTPKEFEEINRWANDAFTGYQLHLDAKEPGEREQLDASYRQLATRLGKLRKRVRQPRGRAGRTIPTP